MGQPVQPTKSEIEKEIVTPTSKTTKKPMPPHFVLTIEGTALIAGSEQGYSVEVKVPDLGANKGDGHYLTFAMSPDNGDLLTKAIKKKYKACEYVRLHSLTDRRYVSSDGTPLPVISKPERGETVTIDNMRKKELLDMIARTDLPIDTELYSHVDELRSAIKAYEQNQEEFLDQQRLDKEAARIKAEAALLNE